LSTTTPGARIAWTPEEGEAARWRVYTGPVELKAGAMLRAKCCRLGWLDSAEVRV
jgi:N-sulfoglucosamine sulfohydrolase